MTVITFKLPEVVFVLFLFSGQFKANPLFERLASLFDFTVLLAALTFVGIAYVLLIEQRAIHFDIRFLMAWYLLCCLMLASLLWTSSISYGWPKAIRFVTLSSLIFLAPVVFLRSDLYLRRFLYTLVTFSVVYSAFAVQIGLAARSSWGFVYLPGANYLALASIAGLGVIVGLLYLVPHGGWLAVAGVLATGVSGVALLLSGGRGPLISLAFTLVFIALAGMADPGRFERTTAILSVSLAAVFVGLLQFNLLPYTLSRRLSLLLPSVASSGVIVQLDAGTGRPERWLAAWEALSSHPLLGLGSGGFAEWFWKKDVRDYPHNIFLEAGAELGIPGLLLVLYLLLFPLCTLFSSKVLAGREIKLLRVTALGIVLFSWIEALFSGDFNDSRLAWMSSGLLVATCGWQSAATPDSS